MAYPVIMGINLGTCVTTAMVCSIGSSKDAKRTGVVHIAFNTIGTVLFLAVMSVMQKVQMFGAEFWTATVDSGGIANFQTVFNLLTAIVLIPFAGWLVKLSMVVVKDDKPAEARHPELHTLDEKLYISPAVAVMEATKAIGAMGVVAQTNMNKAIGQLQIYDPSQFADIDADELELDQFADSVDHFLIGLSKNVETAEDDKQLDLLLQAVPSFERIGDYATNLIELAEKLHADEAEFSDSAKQELMLIGQAVREVMDITVQALNSNDNELAKTIEPLEETIDDMVLLLKDRHTKRLKNGSCSINSGLVFMEALTHLERASDHCSSIAVMMLARTDETIMLNHHDYLQEVHMGNDKDYRSERNRRREQYLKPLKDIQ